VILLLLVSLPQEFLLRPALDPRFSIAPSILEGLSLSLPVLRLGTLEASSLISGVLAYLIQLLDVSIIVLHQFPRHAHNIVSRDSVVTNVSPRA
jgi:hypothetical protein